MDVLVDRCLLIPSRNSGLYRTYTRYHARSQSSTQFTSVFRMFALAV